MLNKNFIVRKISLIEEDILHLKDFSDLSIGEIVSDFGKKAIVERIMERVISRAIDINQHIVGSFQEKESPKDYRDTFLMLAELGVYDENFAKIISDSIGLRNILIHDYDKIDYEKVYSSIGDCVRDYTIYCGHILNFVSNK